MSTRFENEEIVICDFCNIIELIQKEVNELDQMKNKTPAPSIAMGGMFAALGVVIMCLGGMIPVATYICPMICMILLKEVIKICGDRIAWAWYGAVSLLGLLMGPDKEAAAVFLFLGYYPILKPKFDSMRMGIIWKLILFNGSMMLMYWILLHVIGMEQLVNEFEDFNAALFSLMLILGNVIFFMLDIILGRRIGKKNG